VVHNPVHRSKELVMPATPSPDASATKDALATEFDIQMARAGLTIPPARRPALLTAYADLRDQIALLHGRYGPEHEPSNVFRLAPAGDK
jgi:hypothetical protein